MSVSRASASHELLIACNKPSITRLLWWSMSDELADKTELLLAKYGLAEELTLLWRKGVRIKSDTTRSDAFYYARKFNHPQVVRMYQNMNIDFKLNDKQSKANLHEAAFYGNRSSLIKLAKMAANPMFRENVINSFNQADQFGELPLFLAIAGGDSDFTRLAFELTTTKYDLALLPIHALESRNTHLFPIFMDNVIESFKNENPYALLKYILEVLDTATRCSDNPGNAILKLLNSISNETDKKHWAKILRENALIMDCSDIAIALINSIAPDYLEKSFFNDLIIAQKNHSDIIDTNKLVAVSYSAYAQLNPTAISESTKGFIGLAREQYVTHHIENINHLLFALSKEKVPLECFKPLLESYIKHFEKKQGTAIEYLCAAHLAFLFQDYKLAKKWYEMSTADSDELSTNVIFAVKHAMALQILTIFDEIEVQFNPDFIETYKDNLTRLVDSESHDFSLPHDALLFVLSMKKKNESLKSLYDAVYEIKYILPPKKTTLTNEEWSHIEVIFLSATEINRMMMQLHNEYGHRGVIKLNEQSIARAKDSFAVYQTALYIMEHARCVVKQSRLPDSISKAIDVLTDGSCVIGIAIGESIKQLNQHNEQKAKKIQEDKRNAEIKALANAARAEESRRAKEQRKLANLAHKQKLEEEQRIENERARAEKEAAEKALKEEAEKAAKIEAEKKAADKLARDAANKARTEALERKKAARAEREIAAKAEREAAAKASAELAKLKAAEAAKINESVKTTEATATHQATVTPEPVPAHSEKSQLTETTTTKTATPNISPKAAPKLVSDKLIKDEAPAEKSNPGQAGSSTAYIQNTVVMNLQVNLPAPILYPIVYIPVVMPQYTTAPSVPTPPTQPASQPQTAQLIPSQQSQTQAEHPIHLYARQLGFPRIIADLFIKYEGRISLKGGAVRDCTLERKPRDHDFLFFGTFDEIQKEFPQAVKKGFAKMPSAMIEVDGCKIDMTIRPNRSPGENRVIQLAEIDGSDLTINSRHLVITSRGPHFIDPHNAIQHIKERKLVMPNENDAIGIYYTNPVRYFRLKDLNDDIRFTLSAKIIENINEIKNHPEQFIASCRIFKDTISRTIDKMIEHYGEARTYSIIKDDEYVLLKSGVMSNEKMSFLKEKHKQTEFPPISQLNIFSQPAEPTRVGDRAEPQAKPKLAGRGSHVIF